MNKKDFIIGFFIGIIASYIGIILYLTLFTDNLQSVNLQLLLEQKILGKVTTLGTILSVILFFVLLRIKKEFMARGVLFSIIILAIATIFM